MMAINLTEGDMIDEQKRYRNTSDSNSSPTGESEHSNVIDENQDIDGINDAHTTSTCAAFVNLMKMSLGTGLLALPHPFMCAGLWSTRSMSFVDLICTCAGIQTGLVAFLMTSSCATYCMHLLLRSYHKICTRKVFSIYFRSGNNTLEYGELMEKAVEEGPAYLRPTSKFARFSQGFRILKWEKTKISIIVYNTVSLFLLFGQLGACAIDVVFISTQTKQIIHEYFPNDLDVRVYVTIILVCFIPYVLIRHLGNIAYLSGISNVLFLFCVVIIFQFIVRDLPDASSRPAFNSTQYLPMFLGTTIYAIDAIPALLPIINEMATPSDMGGWTGVISTSMVLISCTYAAIGFYGYLKFGASVRGSITENLPATWLYRSMNIMFTVAMLLTFALTYYVPINVIYPFIRERVPTEKHATLLENTVRIGFLAFIGCLALFVPHLDLLISASGAITLNSLTLIFPPFIDFLARSADDTLSVKLIIVDAMLCLLGIVVLVSGTIVSFREIIERF